MIGLMWYLMGMATTAALWGYVHLRRNYQFDLKANLGVLSTFGLGWTCVGWSWASFAEGEPQSGAMGMICFGLPTLILAVVTWRKLIQPAIKS